MYCILTNQGWSRQTINQLNLSENTVYYLRSSLHREISTLKSLLPNDVAVVIMPYDALSGAQRDEDSSWANYELRDWPHRLVRDRVAGSFRKFLVERGVGFFDKHVAGVALTFMDAGVPLGGWVRQWAWAAGDEFRYLRVLFDATHPMSHALLSIPDGHTSPELTLLIRGLIEGVTDASPDELMERQNHVLGRLGEMGFDPGVSNLELEPGDSALTHECPYGTRFSEEEEADIT
jgi:hypothetical protein